MNDGKAIVELFSKLVGLTNQMKSGCNKIFELHKIDRF